MKVSTKTDRATLTLTCSDTESGITKYEYSKDNGSTWVTGNASYTFTGLTQGTSYKYVGRCTNGSGLTNTAGSTNTTNTITNPTIVQASQNPSSGTYATSRVIKITYSNANMNNAYYYFKSSVAASVASGVVVQSCGTGNTPSTCTTSSVTSLVANTWYRTNNSSINVTYTSNGTLYAVTKDNTNISGTSTYSIANIESSNPSIPSITYNGGSNTHSWKNNYDLTLSSSALSGIAYYEIDVDNDGTADYTTGSNFIPWDGFWTCYARFRAVSNVGRKSEWTEFQHIHMDITPPSKPSIVLDKNYDSGVSNTDNITNIYKNVRFTGNAEANSTIDIRLTSNNWNIIKQVTTGSNGTYEFNIDLEQNKTNSVYICSVDAAGNYTCNSLDVLVDTTAPTITYNLNQGIYDVGQTVTVTCNDSNFSNWNVHVYKDGTIVESKSVSKYKNNSYTVKMDSSGTWQIYAIAYDKAGNKQDANANGAGWDLRTYTIKPKISVSDSITITGTKVSASTGWVNMPLTQTGINGGSFSIVNGGIQNNTGRNINVSVSVNYTACRTGSYGHDNLKLGDIYINHAGEHASGFCDTNVVKNYTTTMTSGQIWTADLYAANNDCCGSAWAIINSATITFTSYN